MTDAPTSKAGFRLTGWHVLAAFVVFFGVVAAVDGAMMTDAYRTYPGEVSASPYEEGLAVDKDLARQRTQAALGWTTEINLEPGAIVLTARDGRGAPVVFRHIEARLERPATLQGARDARFGQVAPGVYQAAAPGLTGAWDLTVSAVDAAGHPFEAEQRLVAP